LPTVTTPYNPTQCAEKLTPVYASEEGRFETAGTKEVEIMMRRPLGYDNRKIILPNLANSTVDFEQRIKLPSLPMLRLSDS